MAATSLLLILSGALNAGAAAPGPVDTLERAQAQPVAAPELFGIGVFSTADYELPPTFKLDGRTAYFTVSTPQYGRIRWILQSRRTANGWSKPTVAPFS